MLDYKVLEFLLNTIVVIIVLTMKTMFLMVMILFIVLISLHLSYNPTVVKKANPLGEQRPKWPSSVPNC